jgi:hypothetical protein
VIITGLGLVDIWKNLNKIDFGRTFHHHFGSSILNRVYADRSFVGNFKNIYLQSSSVNNQLVQSTLTWNVDLPNRTRTPVGLCKLDTSVLSEEGF